MDVYVQVSVIVYMSVYVNVYVCLYIYVYVYMSDFQTRETAAYLNSDPCHFRSQLVAPREQLAFS